MPVRARVRSRMRRPAGRRQIKQKRGSLVMAAHDTFTRRDGVIASWANRRAERERGVVFIVLSLTNGPRVPAAFISAKECGNKMSPARNPTTGISHVKSTTRCESVPQVWKILKKHKKRTCPGVHFKTRADRRNPSRALCGACLPRNVVTREIRTGEPPKTLFSPH